MSIIETATSTSRRVLLAAAEAWHAAEAAKRTFNPAEPGSEVAKSDAADEAWFAYLRASQPILTVDLNPDFLEIIRDEVRACFAEAPGDPAWGCVLRVRRSGVTVLLEKWAGDEFEDENDADGDEERTRVVIDYALAEPQAYVSYAIVRILSALAGREAAARAEMESWTDRHPNADDEDEETYAFAKRADQDFDLVVGTGAQLMATAIATRGDRDLARRFRAARRGLNVSKGDLAALAGYSLGSVERWAHGGTTALVPPQDAVERLEAAWLEAMAQDLHGLGMTAVQWIEPTQPTVQP